MVRIFLGTSNINERDMLRIPDSVKEQLKVKRKDSINFYYINGQVVIEKNNPPDKPNGTKKP